MTTDSMASCFYVYELRDPRPGKNLQPIYVGKGQGRRAHFHWNCADDHINPLLRRIFGKIRAAGLRPITEIVCHFDSETDAFQFEKELIAKRGRRDLGLGPLCNLTDGGEGQSGSLVTAETMRKLNTDPEFIRARSESLRKLHADPEFAKANAERARKLHADPEYARVHAERLRKRHTDPDFAKANKERARATMLKLHADPEFVRIRTERYADPAVAKASAECMRKLNADPEFARAQAEGMRKLNADPEFARAQAERARKLNADPVFAKANAERLRKRNADPEWIKAQAERMRKLNTDPEFAKANAERARERIRKLNVDPEFRRRCEAGKAAKRAIAAAWQNAIELGRRQ